MIAVRAAAVAAVLGASLAQTASAATVRLDYEPPLPGIEPAASYTLTVRGEDGEANRAGVASDSGGYTVRHQGAALTAGPGCAAVDPNEVRCPTPRRASKHSIFVAAGRGPDVIAIETHSPTVKVEVSGGRGDDALLGGDGADLLVGGPGDDLLGGREGNDRLDGGKGDDLLDGGGGRDVVTYRGRSAPVVADLASGIGGVVGERDGYVAVESLTGGRGSDRLFGDDGPNTLLGGTGGGRDRVVGRGGDDQLLGHRADGGRGDDEIGARIFTCGPGEDAVYRSNARIRPHGPFARNCESVQSGAVFVRPDPVRRSGRRLVFALRCLWTDAFCLGGLEVRDRRGLVGTKRFRLPAGANGPFRRVAVRLTRRPRSRLGELHVVDQPLLEDDWFRVRLRSR